MTSSRSSVRSSRSSDGSKTLSNPNSNNSTPNAPNFPKQESSVNEDDFQCPEDISNLENDLDQPVPGWPKLALLMAQTPDFASFARFRDLNIKSLLYYQAELRSLKIELHKLEWRDYRLSGKKDERHHYRQRADFLAESQDESGNPGPQWALVLRMRSLLKEYSK